MHVFWINLRQQALTPELVIIQQFDRVLSLSVGFICQLFLSTTFTILTAVDVSGMYNCFSIISTTFTIVSQFLLHVQLFLNYFCYTYNCFSINSAICWQPGLCWQVDSLVRCLSERRNAQTGWGAHWDHTTAGESPDWGTLLSWPAQTAMHPGHSCVSWSSDMQSPRSQIDWPPGHSAQILFLWI